MYKKGPKLTQKQREAACVWCLLEKRSQGNEQGEKPKSWTSFWSWCLYRLRPRNLGFDGNREMKMLVEKKIHSLVSVLSLCCCWPSIVKPADVLAARTGPTFHVCPCPAWAPSHCRLHWSLPSLSFHSWKHLNSLLGGDRYCLTPLAFIPSALLSPLKCQESQHPAHC